METKRALLIGGGALLVLVVAIGLASASHASPAPGVSPTKEPADSPFFDATLQQAVDELDGKVAANAVRGVAQQQPTQHYTTDPYVWPECEFGFTEDLVQWPWCHYTSDPENPDCSGPWPTKDYTWDSTLWPECDPTGAGITQDPNVWCDPLWTSDPAMGVQCQDDYTYDPVKYPWCDPRFTWDPAMWPAWCFPGIDYTYEPAAPGCDVEFTTDPYVWPECHYTSDPAVYPACSDSYPTQDYTTNPYIWSECPVPDYTTDPAIWPWCDSTYTTNPNTPPCEAYDYTEDVGIWPWCSDPLYTADPAWWPWCHYTSDPVTWPDQCSQSYATKDYTYDYNIWPECDALTQDPYVWPWCGGPDIPPYTTDPLLWPWCNQAWTWDEAQWPECSPGYTNDFNIWPECDVGLYTDDPATWPECDYYTMEPRIWPECHYTSDPNSVDCNGTWFPTKDYTTDIVLWPECDVPPGYTSDPNDWPECHYTSDPGMWPECDQQETTELGDAPDSSNHAGSNMTAYPPGGPPGILANFPTVFDPATGLPQGPKHLQPRANAWLGPWVTLEADADLMPDEDGVTNIDPSSNTPNQDVADDGVTAVSLAHCHSSWFTYTVTIPVGATRIDRFVNVWFDWNRDGDWGDLLTCAVQGDAPEWAVQNQLIPAGYTAGTYVFVTPTFLPHRLNPSAPLWMRISIAEQPAPTIPGTPYADGRGPAKAYEYGETEDYFFVPIVQEEFGDLGDAPDSSNHAGAGADMTAYPLGGPAGTVAHFPTVFDPTTGLPTGPKHLDPDTDARLGPGVTRENDADLPPDGDGLTNIDPLADSPDRDAADDGLMYPVNLPDCSTTVFTYTVSVPAGSPTLRRYVNAWFDWNRDGDWQDVLTCTSGLTVSEWAVQDHVISVGPGTHVLQTPVFVPYNPNPDDPLWMRLSIAERPAPWMPGTQRADGRGPRNGYNHGETEDYYLWTPTEEYDIYLKDSDTDDGSVPSSSPWWLSPDIWVRHDGDCSNTTHENPVPGAVETVCIRVRNRMATTVTNIDVNAYWTLAALGISWPGSWSYLGSVHIPSLAGGATTVESVSWNVPFLAGHFCLLARADSPEDPLGSGSDTVSPVDRTKNNNNIAQKNTNVVGDPSVTECGVYTTTVYTETVYLDAVNTWNTTKTVDIMFASVDFPLGTGLLKVNPGSLWGRWTSLTNFNILGFELVANGFTATIGGIDMGPFETARISMTIAAEIDERFTIDVTEWVGGTEVGGIEYVRNLPRCIYLPLVPNGWP